MNGVFGRLFAFMLGALLAFSVASQNVLIFAPDPFIGEFAQPFSSFTLYAGPGTQFERLRDERREARARNREEMVATGAEIGAIRGERERERAAPDRIREKTEAIKQAEDREREAVPVITTGTRLFSAREEAERARLDAEAEARRRAQAERERGAQVARDAAVQAERERLEQARREAAERAAREEKARARAAVLFLATLYGAFLFLPSLPLYRAYIEYRSRHLWEWSLAGGIALSALCGLGAAALAWGGGTDPHPWFVFAAGLLGLPAWFFVPGLLWLLLVFLHSLLVPHPNEALFERVLRGESLSRAEAEQAARAMYDARRDGIPADWRVRGRMWRLERLAALLEKERAFAEKMAENAMK